MDCILKDLKVIDYGQFVDCAAVFPNCPLENLGN